jgi:Ca-activated chloride channel homolog
MRRYLAGLMTISAVAGLVLGCASLGDAASGATGGADGGGGKGEGSPAGSGAATGAGGGADLAVGSDTAPPPPVKPGDITTCQPSDALSPPIYLSIPRARAMVSGAQVRGMLEAKSNASTEAKPPLPGLIHTDELLNYYHIDYPADPAAELTVVTELAPTEVDGDYLLQIGVQAPSTKAPRRATSLTVVVDSSTSMAGESMKRANAAVLALAQSLHQGDVLNLVTTDLEKLSFHHRAQIDADPALFSPDQAVEVGGSGSLGDAVENAYKAALAEDTFVKEGINRVVVITDGGGAPTAINVGTVATHWSDEKIQLVGVGVGSASSYHNDLLAAATRAGHGANLYLDSVEEAGRALHTRFDEVMDESAGALTIAFSLPYLFRAENPDAGPVMLGVNSLVTSDLARGRSMVFRHIVTACAPVEASVLATLKMSVTATWTPVGATESKSMPVDVDMSAAFKPEGSPRILKTSAIVAFGSALQSLQPARFLDACARVTRALASLADGPNTDPELVSIRAQLQAHPSMKGMVCH